MTLSLHATRILKHHWKQRVREAHAAYARQGAPCAVEASTAVVRVLLDAGLSPEFLHTHAEPLGALFTALAELPLEIRPHLTPALNGLHALTDAVPAEQRLYAVKIPESPLHYYGLLADLPRLIAAACRAEHERHCAAQQHQASATRIEAEQLRSAAEVQALLNLHPKTWRLFARSSPYRVELPDGRVMFQADVALTVEQRAALEASTQLSRYEAAAWLGVSPREFDKRKHRRGVEHCGVYGTRSGYPGKLYRLTDVETLRE